MKETLERYSHFSKNDSALAVTEQKTDPVGAPHSVENLSSMVKKRARQNRPGNARFFQRGRPNSQPNSPDW